MNKREIKFRAWDGKEMQSLEGGDIELDYRGVVWLDQWGGRNRVNWPLMQYTGLKDKNGVEIYEGDVVECKPTWCYYSENPIEVRYFAGGYVPFQYNKWDNEDCIIIGNIYENPELSAKTT